MNKLWRLILSRLQGLCKHEAVTADILEGDAGNFEVKWCRTCGAWRRRGNDTWHRPYPTWISSGGWR